jgi:hypothetical protein
MDAKLRRGQGEHEPAVPRMDVPPSEHIAEYPTTVVLPGGLDVILYEPRHDTAI